jgi:hypothetical protein
VADFQVRIENKRGGRLLLAEPIEQTVDQSRLARPDLASKQDQAFAGLDSVCQRVQRFLGLRGQEEVSGIRVNVKGTLAESEEMFVHFGALRLITDSYALNSSGRARMRIN